MNMSLFIGYGCHLIHWYRYSELIHDQISKLITSEHETHHNDKDSAPMKSKQDLHVFIRFGPLVFIVNIFVKINRVY